MGIFLSISFLILAIIIQSFLQLNSGIFALFYHFKLGQFSKKKADSLIIYYILGTEIYTAALWLACFLVMTALINLFPNLTTGAFWWIFAGVFIATSIASFFFYFRKSPKNSTALFLPRKIAKNYQTYALNAKDKRSTLSLGFYVNFPELIFTLPLYLASAALLTLSNDLPRAPFALLLILASIVQLFIIRLFYHADQNLANIIHLRIELKPLVSVILALSFFFLALIIIAKGVL